LGQLPPSCQAVNSPNKQVLNSHQSDLVAISAQESKEVIR